ncbi:MAG: tyrosine-type recombinase/integrase [Armatimonadetes bacterium]|nr:tyrosine-type recombinase/integrase [Armatimonadota bacterium]MDE2205473.1 tyrosine-type recombinase/integrase [Armatimonadota bacterium]
MTPNMIAKSSLVRSAPTGLPAIELLAAIPEEEIWLNGQRSHHTRRAYKEDVLHFMRSLGVTTREELRQVERAAVIAWIRQMEEQQEKARTIRRRLSALSSLYTHLVARRAADTNPVREIKRPRVNRTKGVTAAFSAKQARRILDAPDGETLSGLRDRAILSVLFQAGPRRAEVASMKVKDFYMNAGYHSLRFTRKGGEDHALALNPQTAQRIEQYLAASNHGGDIEGPLFRAVRPSWRNHDDRRHIHPDAIDRIVRKYVKVALNIERGFSAHSCRATFATTSLANGSSLEDVQEALGHADATTTKLYDKRGFNPEKSAAFFANY